MVSSLSASSSFSSRVLHEEMTISELDTHLKPYRMCRCCCELPRSVSGLKRLSCLTASLGLLGCILLLCAVFGPIILNSVIDQGLRKASLIYSADARGFSGWQFNSANPLQVKVYLYDVQNPQEIIDGGKAKLKEIGPYVFSQYKYRFNITWNSDSTEVRYRDWNYYVFEPELSVEPALNRSICSLNVPFISTSHSGLPVGILNYVWGPHFNYTDESRLFTVRSVGDLLFGYYDPALVNLHHDLQSLVSPWYPGMLSNYTFERFLTDPFTDSDYYWTTEYTGIGNMNNVRRYKEYRSISLNKEWGIFLNVGNYSFPSPFYDYSQRVDSHDGSQFHEHVSADEILDIYNPAYFRSVPLRFARSSSYKGCDVLEYQYPDKFFLNSSLNPENANYFQDGPNGLLNLTATFSNPIKPLPPGKAGPPIPLFASQARFVGVEPSVTELFDIEYLPNVVTPPSAIFSIEPISGATFHVIASSQAMFHVAPFTASSPPINWFPNMTSRYFPIFWASTEGGINDEQAQEFKSGVYGTLFLGFIAADTLYGIAGSLIILSLFFTYFIIQRWPYARRYEKAESSALIDESGIEPAMIERHRNRRKQKAQNKSYRATEESRSSSAGDRIRADASEQEPESRTDQPSNV